MWHDLRERLPPGAPAALDRNIHHDRLLQRTDLLWSQTCGYVVAIEGGPPIELIATPHYQVPGCRGPMYRSYVVTPHPLGSPADLKGRIAAINEPCSHSGTNALRCFVAPWGDGRPFFREVVQSGSHRASLVALQQDLVEVAAIDCVFWDLAAQHAPSLIDGLSIVAITEATPAPPFVTAARGSAHLLRRALSDFLTDPATLPIRQALRLGGCSVLPRSAYRCMLRMEHSAARTVPPLCDPPPRARARAVGLHPGAPADGRDDRPRSWPH